MTHEDDPNAPSSQTTPPRLPAAPSGAPPPAEDSCPIVGVGASAGGLEAFTQLLQPLPATPGLAFVLVQHLDPAHESLLAGLLARVTRLPVRQIEDGTAVRPNQVYVAPPQADVVIAHRVLHLIPRAEPRGLHIPIDVFFRSLAEDQGPLAIGIVLSGGGSDGALGLQDIKDHGGLTFVQDERTAAVAGMPHSARMHGAVDVVASPDGLAQALLQLVQHPYVTAPPPADPEGPLPLESDREAWGRILALLRRATGEVSVTWHRDADDHRLLRIQDTGAGLPPGVDPAEPASLGLTIVRMLVEQLGGRLQVERAGGTTVTVRVPFTPGEERA
jgi:two-component system CheB/CheR fusion protein